MFFATDQQSFESNLPRKFREYVAEKGLVPVPEAGEIALYDGFDKIATLTREEAEAFSEEDAKKLTDHLASWRK
jgi:hypothetical protein